MDFSSFTDDNFDLKSWINVVLEPSKSDESVEQHASMLVMKLQLLYLELNNSLEEISVQALQSIPRAMREIEKVRKEATDLKKKIDGFNVNLSKIEDSTVQSLLLISELDKVKSRIEGVTTALKEAEKLTKLTEQIETVFASNNFQKIAEELNHMQNSLVVLKEIPEFRSNQKNLEKLQERLEGIIRPHLLQAFQEHAVDKTQQFVEIFNKINRSNQLLQHYYRCRQVPLEQFWVSFEKKFISMVTPPQPVHNPNLPHIPHPPVQPVMHVQTVNAKGENNFIEWLPTFYEEVLLETRTEASWSSQVFAKELPVIPALLQQTLSMLSPSFRKRIESFILYEANQQPLEDLITLYSVTQTFARTVNNLLSSISADSIDSVIFVIYEPYFPFQNDYQQLERKQLLKSIQKLKTGKTGFSEVITQVNNSIPKLFLLVDSSIERCIRFTNGSEGEALVKTLSDVMAEYLQHLISLLPHLREQAHLDVATPSASINMEAMSSHHFDWTFFQGSLQLLQIVNGLTTRISNFERALRSNLTEQKAVLFTKNSEFKPQQALHLKNLPEKTKRVVAFFQNIEDLAFKLLPLPAQLLTSCAASVHSLVFDSAFSYIKDRFTLLPSMKVWTSEVHQSPMNLPSFSLQPLGYITQIGEHLLTLPHQLEPFSSNDTSLISDTKVASTSNNNSSISMTDDLDSFENNDNIEEEEVENKFTSHWLTAIGSAAMSLYYQRVMDIPSLSEHGSKQLATDIGYLTNVLNALGISIDPNLEVVSTLLNIPKDQYEERLPENVDRVVVVGLAKKRGINLKQ